VRLLTVFFAIACTFMSATAAANLVDDINALRRSGCGGRPGVQARLQPSPELDAVAREWSRGGRLRDALTRTGYRIVNSASMQVEGAPDRAAVLRAFTDHYCETLTDPTFTTVGIWQKPGQVYVVVALPFSAPSVKDAKAISERVLVLVNAARAQPRQCGGTKFPAAPPVTLSAMLTRAALMQAQDMAQHNFFEHEGSDGSTAAVRATRAGYEWRSIGENIAAGPTTADSVVKGWLDSPGHCANIMSPSFTEMGVAYASDSGSAAGIYWSQVFGSPKQKK